METRTGFQRLDPAFFAHRHFFFNVPDVDRARDGNNAWRP
jgi:hypothetical protein